ncbi:metal ABC transporter ATP-binding protein [Austwickia chelonae]|uniref:metal ABC transporter ATP-binding protein n=1 Tax=Austwickia chelonae TaxID=100225 RepID=UPI000E28468C|nr:metal ABC transporter ATP-binding protein [Austwickia chelonae]
MTDRSTVIDVRSASFGYAGRTIVSGIDLHVDRGESLAVLGPNGCGKSTLVRGLLGLNDHLGGKVRVLGDPLAGLRRRSLIGYVPQRHTLSTSVVATVGEIVAIGRLPHTGLLGRLRRRDLQIVTHALEVVGLGGMEKADVTHLSGGQQRRVLVARAMAAEPEILIMDEPTAGVDESNQAVLAQAMTRLTGEGVTLLTVTHELDALAEAVTRIVTMHGGRITDDRPAGENPPTTATGGHHHLAPHDPPGPGWTPLGVREETHRA